MSGTPFELNPKLLDIRGNQTLLLSTSDVVCRIHHGSVAVFAVRVTDNAPVGPRRFLFNRQSGDWLFGSSITAATEHMSFLVLALEDSQLSEVAVADFLGAKSNNFDPIASVESWVHQVCTVLSQPDRQPGHETTSTDVLISLVTGQTIRPPVEDVVWLSLISGSVSIAGSIVSGTGTTIPISSDVAIVAESDCQMRLVPMIDMLMSNVLTPGLQHLHRVCFEHTQRADKQQYANDAQRLAERRRLQALDTLTSIGELGGVLVNTLPRPTVDNELMAVLSIIGETIGVSFRQPKGMDESSGLEDAVAAIAHTSRVRMRQVSLREHWWNKDAGPMLGRFGVEGRPVALIPKDGHYQLFDPASNTTRGVNRRLDGQLSRAATTFLRPLPDAATSLFKLAVFAAKPIAPDLAIIVFLALAVVLLGMLVPISTGLVIDEAIPDANLALLYQLAAGLVVMAFSQAALSFSQATILLRSDICITSGLQSAVIDRLLRLPAQFFRSYSSGDLQNRAMMITEISKEISYTAIGGILTGCMAGLNMFLCFYFNAQLAVIAVVSAVLLAAYTSGLSAAIRNKARDLVLEQGQLFGFQVQLVGGISKLHIAGAQQRAFNHWARRMSTQLRLVSGIQRLEQWGGLINVALNHCSTICLYYLAANTLASVALAKNGASAMATPASALLTMGTFLAFYVAFQKMIEGMTGLSNTLVNLTDSWAKRKLVLPLLEAGPENSEDRIDPGPLLGAVSVSDVLFRYREDGSLILNGINLRADPGQFIAIVGPSGSGKSTLLRLMLGFESPEAGAVRFDGQDLAGLDLTAVRRQIGVVLQSGVVSSGTIFENLAGASRITLDEAWAAARSVGLDADIEQMPMGMNSYVNEGGGTLSGGQRQRLLIARALIKYPRVLLFDEATSALDNRTQQVVTESLDRLRVTRIVVAHRLSTIRQAHAIYVMQDGRIVQSGTFQELAGQEGLFRRMMSRQMV